MPKKVVNLTTPGQLRAWRNAEAAARREVGEDATEGEVLQEICAAYTGRALEDDDAGELDVLSDGGSTSEPTIPEGVTTVVVSRGPSGKHHRPKAGTDDPEPACNPRPSAAGWKEKDVEKLRPFVDPCGICFSSEEPRGPRAITGP